MNGKELFEKITNIDNKFIDEVSNTQIKKRKFNWIAIAACLCFAVTAVFALPKLFVSTQDSSATEGDVEEDKEYEYSTATGFCIVSGSSYMIIIDNCPTVMINETGDETIFDSLQTGDTITIEYGYTMNTYPAQTKIYSLEIIEKGSIKNIPQDIIDSLNELNWEID